jgi:hypothetical protein
MEVKGKPTIEIPLRTPCCNRVIGSVFTDKDEHVVARSCPNLKCGRGSQRKMYKVTVTKTSELTYKVEWQRVIHRFKRVKE